MVSGSARLFYAAKPDRSLCEIRDGLLMTGAEHEGKLPD
jgi:hypothetical protein